MDSDKIINKLSEINNRLIAVNDKLTSHRQTHKELIQRISRLKQNSKTLNQGLSKISEGLSEHSKNIANAKHKLEHGISSQHIATHSSEAIETRASTVEEPARELILNTNSNGALLLNVAEEQVDPLNIVTMIGIEIEIDYIQTIQVTAQQLHNQEDLQTLARTMNEIPRLTFWMGVLTPPELATRISVWAQHDSLQAFLRRLVSYITEEQTSTLIASVQNSSTRPMIDAPRAPRFQVTIARTLNLLENANQRVEQVFLNEFPESERVTELHDDETINTPSQNSPVTEALNRQQNAAMPLVASIETRYPQRMRNSGLVDQWNGLPIERSIARRATDNELLREAGLLMKSLREKSAALMRGLARAQLHNHINERPIARSNQVAEDDPSLDSHHLVSQTEVPNDSIVFDNSTYTTRPEMTAKPEIRSPNNRGARTMKTSKKHTSRFDTSTKKEQRNNDDGFAALMQSSAGSSKTNTKVQVNNALDQLKEKLKNLLDMERGLISHDDIAFNDKLNAFNAAHDEIRSILDNCSPSDMTKNQYERLSTDIALSKKRVNSRIQEQREFINIISFNNLETMVTDLIEQARGTDVAAGVALLNKARTKMNAFNVGTSLRRAEWGDQAIDARALKLTTALSSAEQYLKQKENIDSKENVRRTHKEVESSLTEAQEAVAQYDDAEVLSRVASSLMGLDDPRITRVLDNFFHGSLEGFNGLQIGQGEGGLSVTQNGSRGLTTTNMSQALVPLFEALRSELVAQGLDAQTIQNLEGVLTLLMNNLQRVMTGEAEFLMAPFINEAGDVIMHYINIRDLLSGQAASRRILSDLLVNMQLHGHQGDLSLRVASSTQVAAMTVLMEEMPRLSADKVNVLMNRVLALQGPLTRQALQDVVTGVVTPSNSNAVVLSSDLQRRIDERARSLTTFNRQPLSQEAAVDLMRLLLTLIIARQSLARQSNVMPEGPALGLPDAVAHNNPPRRRNAIAAPSIGDMPLPPALGGAEVGVGIKSPLNNQGSSANKRVRFDLPEKIETKPSVVGGAAGSGTPPPPQMKPNVSKQVKIDAYMMEFVGLIAQVDALKNTKGLSSRGKKDIQGLAEELHTHLQMFLQKPSNKAFQEFARHCEKSIAKAEKQFAKEPLIWKLLRPLCNLMIELVNKIKALIFAKPKVITMFSNVTADTWKESKLGNDLIQSLGTKLGDVSFKDRLDIEEKQKGPTPKGA